ncbi:hypothetical protein ACIRD6_29590 [Streptomyces sp. NPDC102473]|uniref:hypothetical protein n=1 Tax=Streptomyces sp. NPDC102473 TaxID=3366180 RepID=UPI00382C6A59
MDSDTGTFPPYPIRGVRAVYARQAGCPSAFAEVTVDFEPRVEGVVFEVADDLAVDGDDDPEWQAECQAAVESGVRDELALSGVELPPAAVVVLRRMRFHPVDSHPRAFRQVGRLAVRNALAAIHRPQAANHTRAPLWSNPAHPPRGGSRNGGLCPEQAETGHRPPPEAVPPPADPLGDPQAADRHQDPGHARENTGRAAQPPW